MTVYGSSRDQSPGPDEPRRPSPDPRSPAPSDPSPWSPDATSGGGWGDPSASLPGQPYDQGHTAAVHRDQDHTGNAYRDQDPRTGFGAQPPQNQLPQNQPPQNLPPHNPFPQNQPPRNVYGDQPTTGTYGGPRGGNAYGEQGTRNVYGEGTRDIDGEQGRRGHGYGPEDLYGDPGRRRPAFEPTPYGGPPAAAAGTSGSGWQELAGPAAGGSGTRENAGSGVGAPPPGKLKAPRVTGARRTAIIVGAVAVLVIGAGTAAAATLLGGNADPPSAAGPTSGAPVAKDAASAAPSGQGAGAPVGPADGITLSATGDVVMGMAPTGLPPNNGKGFFDPVKSALTADLEMGNLEQTITDDTGVGKCSAANAGKTCFAFRTPPPFVQNLKDAGFGLMNEANNHAYDFGPAGYQNTRKNLDSVGIKYTGWPGEIPVVDVKGVKVAVIGFASYTWSNLCSDLPNATALIKQATTKADLVVVQVHQGGEGADKTHVKPGTEMFLGENRCDPIAFAHNAIDAGADLVIGHGPHVMRAMEFYKGHLIAYSMGNFAGYHALTVNGVLAVGGVLKVTLLGDGTFKGATLASTKMVAPGSPRLDPDKAAISLVSGLSKSDFPTTGAKISATGTITPP